MKILDTVRVVGLSEKIIAEPICNSFLQDETGVIIDGSANTMFHVQFDKNRFVRPYFMFPEELKLA